MLNRRGAQASSVVSTVESRLAAFAPRHLPALFTGLEVDEVQEDPPSAELVVYPKVKTTQGVILLCLNIGNDPPDYLRIEPCARLECWTDPRMALVSGVSAGCSSDSIAAALETQYLSLPRSAVFKKATEVSLEDARHLMLSARRRAEKGRVLLHYNGHGMPRATSLGEIWFFDKNRTHYVPLNIVEMAHLLDSPAFYVLDCNSAGSVLQHWYKERLHEKRPHDILICACSADAFLPMNPQLPADMLTSCLTTPLCMALEWYISYSHRKHLLPHVTAEMIRNVPGDISDPNTPRGDLNRILAAVTDTIAWCTLPTPQFYQLFRQDSMTTTLLQNFFLADRLLREVGCVPVAYPPISEEAHLHHAWDLWEYTLERVISQLPRLLTSELRVNPSYMYRPSTFFMDQLTAFEVWVEAGNLGEKPEELPSILLALTQPLYCVPALTLLVKYLDSGTNAGKRAIDCGILPYAKNLLRNTQEVFLIMTVLWMQLIRADAKRCTAELVKWRLGDDFIRVLELDDQNTKVLTMGEAQTVMSRAGGSVHSHVDNSMVSPANGNDDRGNCGTAFAVKPQYYLMRELDLHRCKAMACYILCQLLKSGGEGMCVECWNNQLLNAAFSHLASPNAEVRSWSCLVLAQLFFGLRHAKKFASRKCTTHFDLFTCPLQDKSSIVRSSCVTLLASLVGFSGDHLEQQVRCLQMEKSLIIKLRCFIYDASMSVREELVFFACRVLFHYGSLVPHLHSSTVANRYMEYVQDVGKNSSRWVLDEPDVQIKSQLSASRPTVNSRFDDTVVFRPDVLERDDPAPPAAGFGLDAINSDALTLLQGMVHDAALMLFKLRQTCDTSKVTAAINALENNNPPQSHRFENEALRSMCCVVSTDSSHFSSEADRARSTKNEDSMQQLVLDMQGRKLEPPLLQNSKIKNSRMENDTTVLENGGTLTSAFMYSQVLPSLIPSDQVICAVFRALELETIFATKNQQIHHTSYETYTAHTFIRHFSVSLDAPLHDMLVINDLAEQAGLLLVNKQGGHSAWSVVDEQPRVVDVIGDALQKAGYNRYGRERLIDGISGEEMEAEVFMGISGYQRLRHMVNDKWQARARTDTHTHRAVTKTGQPVKGRKRHGGVRVGEMERDGLLSHGSAEVVVDRLLHVSDKTRAFICVECGSLLSIYERHATEYATWKTCKFCGAGSQEANDTIAFVEIPQVLRLWATELASIGIRVVLKTSDEGS